MRWQIHCAIDSAKAVIPFQAKLRLLKDSFIPYRPDLNRDTETIRDGLRQIRWIKDIMPLQGLSMLEIGSGWQPMIPFLYSLSGASKVFLTDRNVLLRPDTFAGALQSLRSRREMILAALKIEPQIFDFAVREDLGISLEDRLSEMHLGYMAPCDCRQLSLPSDSLDVITSRACLEHIPPDVIQAIFHESFRLLRPGGITCHVIDLSDHWEHRDKSLSRVNFLKYSDSFFRWTHINSLNYQNRLRHSEYIKMLQKAGFRLLREERLVDESALRSLPSIRLGRHFRQFSPEDLATTDNMLLCVKD